MTGPVPLVDRTRAAKQKNPAADTSAPEQEIDQRVYAPYLPAPRSVAKWSQGEPPSPKQEVALVEMDRLLDGLSRVMEPSQVGRWLKAPNPAFDGSTPLQVVERGEIDRIWRMLFDLESGQPG